jgi:flagellar FliL protein
MPDPNAPAAAAAKTAPARGKSKLLVITVALVAALGAAGAGVYFMRQGAGTEAKAAAKHVEPIYVALDPPFVVNFESNGLVRFLQVTVQAMSQDAATAELIKRHDPVIRNGLLMLFSGQTYESLKTTAGKEQLRQAALVEVRKIITAEGGKGAEVRNLYFTSFVMQ